MICRLCLADLKLKNSVSLFNEFDSDDDPQLVTIIAKHLHLDITWDDEVSTTICSDCCKHLSDFEKFCIFVKEQQIKLIQKETVVGDQNVEPVKESIKLEPDEDIVPKEIEVQCEPVEDIITKEIKVQCEADEGTITIDMQLARELNDEEGIITKETRVHCNSDKDIVTEESQLQCELGKTVNAVSNCEFNSPRLQSSVICSASSSYTKPSSSSFFHQAYAQYVEENSTSFRFISDKHCRQYIPDATSIMHLLPLQNIYQSYLKEKPLDIHDRITIAKSVIEDSLKYTPGRVLNREDFMRLAKNITKVFPSERVSTYYVPPIQDQKPSGKLWCIYETKQYKKPVKLRSELNKQSKPHLSAKTIKTKNIQKPQWDAERWRTYRSRMEIYTKNLKELRKKEKT